MEINRATAEEQKLFLKQRLSKNSGLLYVGYFDNGRIKQAYKTKLDSQAEACDAILDCLICGNGTWDNPKGPFSCLEALQEFCYKVREMRFGDKFTKAFASQKADRLFRVQHNWQSFFLYISPIQGVFSLHKR